MTMKPWRTEAQICNLLELHVAVPSGMLALFRSSALCAHAGPPCDRGFVNLQEL